MKKVLKVIGIVLVLLILLSFVKNILAKTAISAGVRAITGLQLNIGSMNVGILRTLIGGRDLMLFNPPGFKDRLMIDMPEIYVDYDLGAFLRREVHLERVRLNLKEFVVVKNERGELNLDSLKVVKGSKTSTKRREMEMEAKKMPSFQIDVLELKIGKAIYKDYSSGIPPTIQEFNVNIDERYENINNPYTFGRLVVSRALIKTAIARLANFDLGALNEGLGETLKKAGKIAEQVTGKTFGKGMEAVTEVEDAAKKAAETIKSIFPFEAPKEE